MTIRVKPSDIVKYCLWDKYVYFVLNSNTKEAEELLTKDEEMELSEQDAYIIGLLRVMITTNIVHKFNMYMIECLANKSTKEDDVLYIKKKIFEYAIDTFMSNFPSYYHYDVVWQKAIDDCEKYIADLKENIKTLKVYSATDDNVETEFYSVNNVKKLLKFNY